MIPRYPMARICQEEGPKVTRSFGIMQQRFLKKLPVHFLRDLIQNHESLNKLKKNILAKDLRFDENFERLESLMHIFEGFEDPVRFRKIYTFNLKAMVAGYLYFDLHKRSL